MFTDGAQVKFGCFFVLNFIGSLKKLSIVGIIKK